MDGIHVRVATPEDLAGCMDLFVQATEEDGIEEMNARKLLDTVWPSLHQEGGLVGVIGAPGDKPEAAVLLRIEHLWYSDAPVISEKLAFVHPEYRVSKGGRAKKLCEFSKRVSDEMGIPLVIGIVSTDQTKGKVRLYERVFGSAAGAFFLHKKKAGATESNAA